MMRPKYSLLRPTIALLAALAVFSSAIAQTPPQTPPAPRTPRQRPPGAPGAPGAPGQAPTGAPTATQAKTGPKPYEEVITKEAKSDPGMFTVHRIGEKIFFEIPASELGKEILLASEIAGVGGANGSFSGMALGHKVVRFTRRENTIFLRQPNYSARAEGTGAIAHAVESANLEPILEAFNVEAEGKNKSVVIDMTRFFTSDPPEASAKGALGAGGVDPTKSFIERAKSFPTNIEVTSNLTFTPGGAPSPFAGRFGGGGGGAITALVHYSLVRLPEKPMMPRVYDSRVGYFTESFDDYGLPENRVVTREYIARYRLEKKDPNATLSEPVKPIVYYISREVPEWLHPYLKAGVEDWSVAFEQAGFKNAIICKDAPTLEEDPNWDPEDARYSVIRWAPTQTENAQGPHTSDPRTGEILSAHIIVWHNVMKLAQTWYFTQVADLDPLAAKLPLPQDLTGRILRYVVSHEVGHTLGLRHNHKASSSYTVDQLRSKEFTDKYGDEASIMDYGRFNYVAQPGDNAKLIPIIAPYDKFAIEWGYKPFPDVQKPDDEKGGLDKIAARQIIDPMLRFGGEDLSAQSDPTVQTEDLGSDPVAATRYGLMNIDRIAKMLIPATTKFGEDYDLLAETYADLWSQRLREFGHVAKLVGGVIQTDYHAGRGGAVFAPVTAARQAGAVKFLIDNAFTTPKNLISPDILQRIKPAGVQAQVLQTQRYVLSAITSTAQITRMGDAVALDPTQYTVAQLIKDIQGGIWSELMTTSPTVDIYRRNLQRAYLETMRTKLQVEQDASAPSDLRGVVLGSLKDLQGQLSRATVKTTDAATKLHILDCQRTIGEILAPRTAPRTAAAGFFG